MVLAFGFVSVPAVRNLRRVRARDRPDARFGLSDVCRNFLSSFFPERTRHELLNTISVPKLVWLNTKFIAIIDLGSKTYIGRTMKVHFSELKGYTLKGVLQYISQ